MQTFVESFRHSRSPGSMETGRSETVHYPAGLPSRHCEAATYPARARSSISNPSTCYNQETTRPASSTNHPMAPGHAGIEGNERVDQAAKQAASKSPGRCPREISLAFACRARTEAATIQKQRWLTRVLGQRSQQGQRMYRPQKNWWRQPYNCTSSQAPSKPLLPTEVRTCSHRNVFISDSCSGRYNLSRMWFSKGDNTSSSL